VADDRTIQPETLIKIAAKGIFFSRFGTPAPSGSSKKVLDTTLCQAEKICSLSSCKLLNLKSEINTNFLLTLEAARVMKEEYAGRNRHCSAPAETSARGKFLAVTRLHYPRMSAWRVWRRERC